MNTKEEALKILAKKKEISTKELVQKVGVSRQHASAVISALVGEGKVIRLGGGPHVIYVTPGHHKISEVKFKKRFENKGLKEHEVLDSIKREWFVLSQLPENVRSIFDYALSEMLNNAIEHSESKFIEIEVGEEKEFLLFIVDDQGIGAFRNVMGKRGLTSELEAIQDLLKGKTTTQPQAHSGEGIFFTARAADIFILESFGYRLRVDNTIEDVFIEKLESEVKGTRVIFRVNKKTEKHLSDIFKKYQTGTTEFGFDTTEIKIKLYTTGTIYVSRSQARRVMAGLEEFESIILDFDKVPTIGQAFADEIFRVFKNVHPKKKIVAINTNEAVQFMIGRVRV